MDDRIDRLESRLQQHEERMTKLEISRERTDTKLENIDGKIDQLLKQTAHIQENFVSAPTCVARQENMKEDVNGLGTKVREIIKEFNAHIKDHWSKADRYATRLTAALLSILIIGKIAKLF